MTALQGLRSSNEAYQWGPLDLRSEVQDSQHGRLIDFELIYEFHARDHRRPRQGTATVEDLGLDLNGVATPGS